MIRDSLFLKGAVLGLILPTLAFLIYSNIVMEGDMLALYFQLKAMDVHTHVLSLCTFLNLIPFLIFIRSNREKPAQGILMVTILLALFVMVNKFLF
ncbi:MAG: hypothetical protein P8I29_00860 [Flavobacteriales bacterium]|jgi:hypothetical protein|nr:hypothetical protein [Flavobacteriales bacterium]|tara:strand:+ start:1085 stop:1372 length:288 start_codon:yes stop_codon:yes gene_type:complete